jgi:hypothetical protein
MRSPDPVSDRRVRGQILPFRRLAREKTILALVAVVGVSVVQIPNTQDKTRLALTQAVAEHGELTIGRYGVPIDHARYRGRIYTDKAPGLSFLALPAVGAVRALELLTGGRTARLWESTKKLWFTRAVVLVPFLLLLVWLQGRVAEGLVQRTGAAAAVACGLGTMIGALSSVLFGHVPATALAFAAFVVLARARSRVSAPAAGALAGTAVLIEYQTAIVAVLLVVYALLKVNLAAATRYVAGAVPAVVALGAYNWLAFGSPLHLSYRYVGGSFEEAQSRGIFGIGSPRLESLRVTLLSEHGLVVTSPVLVAAAAGLLLLWRRGFRAEALVAATIGLAFVLLEASYFLPLGGISPGPRFLTPALPFILLGLPLVLQQAPRAVAALVLASVAVCTFVSLTWFTLAGARALPGAVAASVAAVVAVGIALRQLVARTAEPLPHS